MRVADHLRMPLCETLDRVPASELGLWLAKFEADEKESWQRPTALHWYLAQIAAVIGNLFRKRPEPISSYILKFDTSETKKTVNKDPLSSKHIWLGILGVKVPKDKQGESNERS